MAALISSAIYWMLFIFIVAAVIEEIGIKGCLLLIVAIPFYGWLFWTFASRFF
jgi:hypothetical protein